MKCISCSYKNRQNFHGMLTVEIDYFILECSFCILSDNKQMQASIFLQVAYSTTVCPVYQTRSYGLTLAKIVKGWIKVGYSNGFIT